MRYVGIERAHKNILRSLRRSVEAQVARCAPCDAICRACGARHATWQENGRFLCDFCVERNVERRAA